MHNYPFDAKICTGEQEIVKYRKAAKPKKLVESHKFKWNKRCDSHKCQCTAKTLHCIEKERKKGHRQKIETRKRTFFLLVSESEIFSLPEKREIIFETWSSQVFLWFCWVVARRQFQRLIISSVYFHGHLYCQYRSRPIFQYILHYQNKGQEEMW